MGFWLRVIVTALTAAAAAAGSWQALESARAGQAAAAAVATIAATVIVTLGAVWSSRAGTSQGRAATVPDATTIATMANAGNPWVDDPSPTSPVRTSASAWKPSAQAGHAFLSYDQADSAKVDELQRALADAGIRVWRGTRDLLPGQDWRTAIRRAINDDALAFLACFSSASVSRAKSQQNEELVLAIDQLRQRRPDVPWLIPVRLDDCEIPDHDIGGGRTLTSLYSGDLFGPRKRDEVDRLIAAVRQILNAPT